MHDATQLAMVPSSCSGGANPTNRSTASAGVSPPNATCGSSSNQADQWPCNRLTMILSLFMVAPSKPPPCFLVRFDVFFVLLARRRTGTAKAGYVRAFQILRMELAPLPDFL